MSVAKASAILYLDPEQSERKEKVSRIFHEFDANADGGLDRNEITALVKAANPRIRFSRVQITAILDAVFRQYGEYIDGNKGLSLDGLLRTYDDGAGDVDRDFDTLGLEIEHGEDEELEENPVWQLKQRAGDQMQKESWRG